MREDDLIVQKEKEYIRNLSIIGIAEPDIFKLVEALRPDNIPEEVTHQDEQSIFGYKHSGSITRKPRNKTWIDPRSIEAKLPFSIIDHKVAIPKAYQWIKKDNEPNLELIYNLTMCSSNVYFWFLLRYYQKLDMWKLLKEHPDAKVWCYRDPYFTFNDLANELAKMPWTNDPAVDIIQKDYDRHLFTKEMQKMIENNLNQILEFERSPDYFLKKVCQYFENDVYISNNLKPYRALIWEWVKDKVAMFDIPDSRRLDAKPDIKAIYFSGY